MQGTTSHKSALGGAWKVAFAVLFCGLLSLVTTGCGSSSSNDDGIVGGPFPVNSGGFRVQLTEAALAALYPQANTNPVQVNNNIGRFTLYVYDQNAALVATRSALYNNGGLDLIVSDLPVTQYSLVLAGRTANGVLVGNAARTSLSFPLAGGLQLISGANFFPYPGFIIPTDTDVPATLAVQVVSVQGIPRVTWNGGTLGQGPAAAISAVPVDLLDDLANGDLTLESPALLDRSLILTSNSGTDVLPQQTALTDEQTIPGVTISNGFDGFDGTTYRVSVTRANGDTGFTDLVLTSGL